MGREEDEGCSKFTGV